MPLLVDSHAAVRVERRLWSLRMIAVSIAAVSGLLLAGCGGSGAKAAGSSSSTTSSSGTSQQANWTGTDAPCRVLVSSTKQFGDIYGTFHTCPPKRVLLIGDSIALTLGFGLGTGEENYGVVFSGSTLLGCAWLNGGQHLTTTGQLADQNPLCLTAFASWERAEASSHAQAVIIELGHWDCFDWIRNGQTEHIGQTAYDDAVVSSMDSFLKALTARGVPVILLTVPVVSTETLGSPDPAADPVRHADMNRLLAQAAASIPDVYLFDINPIIAPGGVYASSIDGHACRTADGIHFEEYCGALVQKQLLPEVRQIIASHHNI
ncbi:MAG TPA: SGNH hydrolase domain-containing protein [Acidimicrobiales bacterium]|nr:SGNH hydrolase domain-containing protein [Acidimicrobiales bacterium]